MKNYGKLIQFVAVISATLNTISDGMQYAWTSAVTPVLISVDSPVQVTDNGMFWLEYVLFIAGVLGVPLVVYFTKTYGRKVSILIAAAENIVAWILMATATSLPLLYVGRFISGLAAVVGFVSVPMYIAEIAEKEIRGFLASWIYMMMMIGFVLINAIGPFVTILTSSMIAACFPLLLLLTFPFLPETPYFLILNGKVDAARNSLRKLRAAVEVDEELEQIASDVLRQQSERGKLIDLIKVPSNRKALLIMAVLNSSQHMSGFSVILMNLQSILIEGNSYFSPSSVGIVFTIAMLIVAFISVCLVDKLGRRFLLILSSALTGLVLLCLSIYYGSDDIYKDSSCIPGVLIVLYAVTFKIGLGIVPIVTTGELFPTSVKSTGMAVADCWYSIFTLISVLVFQVLCQNIGIYSAFLLFGLCALLTSAFTYFYIPETSGKTLEEIQMILKGKSYVQLDDRKYGTTA